MPCRNFERERIFLGSIAILVFRNDDGFFLQESGQLFLAVFRRGVIDIGTPKRKHFHIWFSYDTATDSYMRAIY